MRENGGKVIQGGKVTNVLSDDEDGSDDPGAGSGDSRHAKGVQLTIGGKNGEEFTYYSTEVIGAGGYQCPVARQLSKTLMERKWSIKSTTAADIEYWKNVKGCEGTVGDIEIHFVDSVIPGYFWDFSGFRRCCKCWYWHGYRPA